MNAFVRLRVLSLTALSLALAAPGPAAAAELPRRSVETIKGTGKAKGKKVSFEMVLIPGGRFTMGSPEGEKGRRADEGPQHEVELSPFYLCTTETTWDILMLYLHEVFPQDVKGIWERKKRRFKPEQLPDPAIPWSEKGINNLVLADIYSVDAITGPTDVEVPYHVSPLRWVGRRRPVMGVTWFAAVDFCRWLRLKTGRKYRLPSEAEWEYACRAGSKTAYSFGDDPVALGAHAWYEDNAGERTERLAQKKPNPWGLHDMHGNVREWCHDFYDPRAYDRNAKARPARNPFGPKLPTKPKERKTPLAVHERYHVARGGAWDSPAEDLRSAARGREVPAWRYTDPRSPKDYFWLPGQGHIGFRVACEADSLIRKNVRAPRRRRGRGEDEGEK